MVENMQRPHMAWHGAKERLAKLIALISGLPALSCHVAAKFLRVTWPKKTSVI